MCMYVLRTHQQLNKGVREPCKYFILQLVLFLFGLFEPINRAVSISLLPVYTNWRERVTQLLFSGLCLRYLIIYIFHQNALTT